MSWPSASGAWKAGRPGEAALLAGIEIYRLTLSPWLGGHCRFVPSCSAYAEEAFERHGTWRGLRLTAWRLLRCQPLSRGGPDPVP